jgi:recombination associated protein RdgC
LFKNLIVYRIGPDWSATVEHMEEALAPARFVECGATQQKSIGWIEPRGEKHGALVESIGGQRILKLQIETKAVPGSVVKRKAQEQIGTSKPPPGASLASARSRTSATMPCWPCCRWRSPSSRRCRSGSTWHLAC